MSAFPATIHHVAVTVTDLTTSRAWYASLFGTDPVLDEDVPALDGHHPGFHHTIFVLGGGTIVALHTHGERPVAGFDEHAPGLDHIGFGCVDHAEIERLRDRLDELGIRHGGIAEDSLGNALSFRDPDGVALEFWAPRG